MQDVFLACRRAFASMLRPDIFWHLLWPSLLAILIWISLAIFYWNDALAALLDFIAGWPLLGAWLTGGETARMFTSVLINIVLLMFIVPLVFVSSAIFVSLLALPLMLDRVSATDYADLALRRGGSIIGSMTNALWALLLFLFFAAITLPLWLIPGMGLLLSVSLAAWLNIRCYRYDALMNHAEAFEMQRLWRERRGGMWLLGLTAGVLAFVPLLNFLVPAFIGLAFVHYLLEALRRLRAGV